METTSPEASATGGGQNMVPTQLAILVPSFDPSRDDLRTYVQKVELLATAWPKEKISELITRLILGCSGSAFQKLQLQKDQLAANDLKSVAKLIEILGGHWGQIPLEKKYQCAERALFHCIQKQDESNDSFLARADILWTELISKQIKLEELQSYIVLRGSGLSAEDKKRVVVESNLSGDSALTMPKVSQAIRMLGAGFFHDVTGQRRGKTKVYDPETAMITEDDGLMAESSESVYNAVEDTMSEGDVLETLIAEGDEDAIYIADFESAAGDVLQSDTELASCYNTYLDARRKLAEKARHRGFWPSTGGNKSKGKGRGFQSGKGKGIRFSGKGGKKSLQYRIMNSTCRRCGQTGHWKAECPMNQSSGPPSSASANTTTAFSEGPSSSGHRENVRPADIHHVDSLPLEFLNLDAVQLSSLDEEPQPQSVLCLMNWVTVDDQGNSHRNHSQGRDIVHQGKYPSPIHTNVSPPRNEDVRAYPSSNGRSPNVFSEALSVSGSSLDVILATSTCSRGSCGVLDSGATKTVIGSQHVADLIAGFDHDIRGQLKRSTCSITFRFGNQGTLDAKQSLIVPLGKLLLQIAIVPGATPFLISNSLIRALKCTVDANRQEVRSPMLKEAVPLELTSRGLFLIDLNRVARASTIELKNPIMTYHHSDECHTSENIETFHVSSPHKGLAVKSNHPFISASRVENCVLSSDRQTSHRDHVHPQQPIEESPCARSIRSSGSHSNDFGGTVSGEDSIRGHSSRQNLCSGVAGSSILGAVDDITLQQFPQIGTSQVHGLRGEDGSGSREGWRSNPTDRSSREQLKPESRLSNQSQEQVEAQDHAKGQGPTYVPQGNATGCGTGTGGARFVVRSRALGDNEHSSPHGDRSGRGSTASSDAEPRDDVAASCGTPDSPEVIRDQCYLCNDLAGDFDQDELNQVFDVETSPSGCLLNRERSRMNYLIQKYTSELEEVIQNVRPSGNPYDLFEVFCGEKSQITHQCQKQQGLAMRFGLPDDLQSTKGRQHLFTQLVNKAPENIWFSPVCRPWSAWSQFNGHRSQLAWEDLLSQRYHQLEQVALGIVLFRYQKLKGRHMHWEQPQRSLMLKLPYLSEILSQTRSAEFDMCEVGDLRDPQTDQLIKKGMVVITTSPKLFEHFHGHKCSGNHPHQQLEGSIHHRGQTMTRTQYSESYPRKFARQVAQLLCRRRCFRNAPYYACLTNALINAVEPDQSSGRLVKRPRMTVSSRATLKQPSISVPPDVPCSKRLKLSSKQTVPTQKEIWEKIFQDVNTIAPRVGKKIVSDPEIIKSLQTIWDDKEIQFLVICRGTDRALGPNQSVVPGEVPFRRCAFIHRSTGTIHTEDHWERWDNLSQRQINRANHPCRLNMTAFARNPASVSQQVPTEAPIQGESQSQLPDSTVLETPSPSLTDEGSVKHGAKFLALPSEDRNMILKIHRNLGHPTTERLMHLLRQQGFRSDCVQAVPDMLLL